MRIGSLWPNFLQISHTYVFYNHKHLYIDIGPFVRYSCISRLSSYFEILHRSQGYHPHIRFVSIYQQLHCLFSRFLRQTAMKISKLRIIDPSRDKSIGDWCILFYISKLASQHYAEINRWAMNQIFSRNRCLSPQCLTSNGSWCMGIKGEMSGTVCVTFTWYMYIYELFIAFVCFVVCSLL